MRRRVGFARAIALAPEILLFDEPTTGLDPITTDVIMRVIEELGVRLNPTTVTITHDLKVAFAIADRVALLYAGKIALALPPEEFEKADDPHAAAFVRGDSTLEPEDEPGPPPPAGRPSRRSATIGVGP
jgi:phospholipid/cholesterol/gamma-HCH transport system ATP-binding protein